MFFFFRPFNSWNDLDAMRLATACCLTWSWSTSSTMDPGQQTSSLIKPSGEYFSWEYRVHLIGLGFGFYAAIFFLSHFLSVALSHTYRSLLNKEKVFWNLAATRAVFGIQSSVAGLRALTEDSSITRDRVRGQADWSWFNILTATGFFVFENVTFHSSNVIFWSFDLPLATHHFFALAGYAGAVVWDSQGHFLPMVTLLLEMSTPFTCVSWMLLKVPADLILYFDPYALFLLWRHSLHAIYLFLFEQGSFWISSAFSSSVVNQWTLCSLKEEVLLKPQNLNLSLSFHLLSWGNVNLLL